MTLFRCLIEKDQTCQQTVYVLQPILDWYSLKLGSSTSKKEKNIEEAILKKHLTENKVIVVTILNQGSQSWIIVVSTNLNRSIVIITVI